MTTSLHAEISNFDKFDVQPSQARVGFQMDDVNVTVNFTTDEMPEYSESPQGTKTYAVYKLSCPVRTAYQFTHMGYFTHGMGDLRKDYIRNFLQETSKIGAHTEARTYTYFEDRENGYYSYITRAETADNLTVALFSDFLNVEGNVFVLSQLKILVNNEDVDPESGRDIEFFKSIRFEN